MFIARTFPVLVIAALAAGCAATPQQKMLEAEDARHQADKERADVTQATRQQEAELGKNAAGDRARIERDGAAKIGDAEINAAQKAADARDSLAKARAEARDNAAKKLESLDKEVVEVTAKLERSLPRPAVDTIVRGLMAKSAAVRRSMADLASTTPDNFEAQKKAVEARLSDLDDALSNAKKRT